MPGTFATLAAIPLYLALDRFGLLTYVLVTLLALVGGVYLCHRANADFGTDDHPAAAWDEIAGFLVAMLAIPPTGWTIALGVLLFRYFDIAKPGPIGWVDRHVHGGIGVILDDLLAAIATCLILHGLVLWGWLK